MASAPNADLEASPPLLLDKEWERQQIRTFTSWINFQLKKAGISIKDISQDLRDGKVLTRLLEVISGESLPPTEKKNLRVHQVNNVNRCLDFIAKKGVKLAGIGSEEIVDGNLKMTLGCIWVIILRFVIQSCEELGKHDGLLLWVKKKTEGYRGVNVTNFTSSFADGLAFNALIHRHRPELFNYDTLSKENPDHNLNHAFDVAEKHIGIPRMLDVEDTKNAPDSKSIMTYISAFYHEFSKTNTFDNAARRINRVLDTNSENAKKIQEYERIASDLLEWINKKIADFKDFGPEDQPLESLLSRLNSVNKYRGDEKPPKAKDKAELENLLNSIKTRLLLQKRPEFVPMEGHSMKDIDEAWGDLNHHEKVLLDRLHLMIQQLYYIDHLLKKFYNKCGQQDKWMQGKNEPLKIEVSTITMEKLLFCKNKVVELTNDCETRKTRLAIITSLRDKLGELNCREMPKVQSRYDSIMGSYSELQKELDSFSAKLKEREAVLLKLDEMKKQYAQKAVSLNAYIEDGLEDMSDTYHVHSVAETETLQKELKDFTSSISPQESIIQECCSLESQIAQSVDPTNLYCSIKSGDLKKKFDDLKTLVKSRDGLLTTEKENQQRNEKLRLDFAKLADEIEKFKNQVLQKVQTAADHASKLEDHIASLKTIAGEVDIYYKERYPKLEEHSKKMQEYQIFHNPHTPHTFESINADYQGLFDLLSSSINEVENQVIVRDSSNITDQQMKEFRKNFDYFDKNKVGFLMGDDFVNFLLSMEYDVAKDDPASQRELKRIQSKCDPDNTGKVTFPNFINFKASESKDTDTAESIIESFRVLSSGKDYITPDLIKRYLPDKADSIISKMSRYTGPDAPADALDFKSFASAIYGESEL